MFDPFAAALDAQFNAPGSAAADYVVGSASPLPIRVILSRPDRDDPFGTGQVISRTVMINIRRSDVPAPTAGALVKVGSRDADGVLTVEAEYHLTDEPMSDVEAMTWECGAQEVAQ